MKKTNVVLTATMDGEKCEISDGYHTFAELYDHRIALWIALCQSLEAEGTMVWRSKLHSDGSCFFGWFVLGIGYEKGEQITYHLPLEEWDRCKFAKEVERAPEFDGHTSADVLKRIKEL